MKLRYYPEDQFILDKKKVFGTFFTEIIRYSRLCGISGRRFVWLYLKYGFKFLDTFRFGSHYYKFTVLDDDVLASYISYALELSQSFSPIRTVNFSKLQSASLVRLLLTYTKDPLLQNPNYVSATEKRSKLDRYRRFGRNIIYDKGDLSFFRRPAYYIVRKETEDVIVIRGSCNAGDGFTDLDYTQEKHHGFYFHGGFWAAANLLFSEIYALTGADVSPLFAGPPPNASILVTERPVVLFGHSMGASIAVILAFLLRLNKFYAKCITCGMSCVADFAFYYHSKQFCVSVVNGFDFVPTISYHAEAVYLLRTVLRELKFRQNDGVPMCVDVDEFDNQTVVMPIENDVDERAVFAKALEKCVSVYRCIPPTRILSQLITRYKDLFIAGRYFQFIKGKLFAVSVHDFSDIYFTIQSLLDHQSYTWVANQLSKQYAVFERNLNERSFFNTEP